ncbi:MAG: OprD family outer membrane porin [Colwellia sp.]
MKAIIKAFSAAILSVILSVASHANEQVNEQVKTDGGAFFGNLRVGYIVAEDAVGENTTSSAFGGKLGYVSESWRGLTLGTTLYATQKLFNDENGDFFASDGESYAILGEIFVQGHFGNTEIKAGRFGFDSPYADTDDIRMVPNTFSGAMLSNTDIANTTLYAVYIDEWSGVDSEKPEEFTELNGDEGIFAIGAVFEGIDHLALQGWFYQGKDFTQLSYAEAMYEVGDFVLGAQLANQTDKTADSSGHDGDVYGVMASYALNSFTYTVAYNGVSGTVTNGFGGGPYFTSSAEHTLADVLDQKALAASVDYTGIDKLTLSVFYIDLDEDKHETDLIAAYEFNDTMNIEAIYHHLYDDGDFFLVIFNMGF